MKNILILLTLFLFSFKSFGISETLKNDNFVLGQPTSGNAKSFSFDFGLGVNNPKFLSTAGTDLNFNLPFSLGSTLNVTGDSVLQGNNLTVGDGTSSFKKQVFDIGAGVNNPYLGYNPTTSAIVFNNGVVEKKLGSGSGSGGGGVNLLSDKNNGFEDGKLTWIETGLTYSIVSYTNQAPNDLQYASIVATLAAQKLTSASVTLPDNSGFGCEAQISFNTVSGNQNYTLKVFNGATLLGSQLLTGTGTWIKSPILPFKCSANMTLVIESAGAGNISVDNAYLGNTRGISNSAEIITDMEVYGPITITATTTNPIKATSPIADVLKCRRVGEYLVVDGLYQNYNLGGSAGSGDYLFEIPLSCAGFNNLQIDLSKITLVNSNVEGGTSNFSVHGRVGDFSGIANAGVQFEGPVLIYDSTHFRLGAGGTGATTVQGMVGSLKIPLSNIAEYSFNFKVPIVGWSVNPYKTYSPDVTSFSVSGKITGANALVTPVVGVETRFIHANFSLSNLIGNTGILCDNSTDGTSTCATGNEKAGFWFDTPVSGEYRISSHFNTYGSISSNDSIYKMRLVDISGTKIASGLEDPVCNKYSTLGGLSINSPCSLSVKVNLQAGRYRVEIVTISTASVATSLVADNIFGRGLTYEVNLMSENVALPVILNQVRSHEANGVKIYHCDIANLSAGVFTFETNSCDWISNITYTGSFSRYDINFTSPINWQNRSCTIAKGWNSGEQLFQSTANSPVAANSNKIMIGIANATGVESINLTASGISIICIEGL